MLISSMNSCASDTRRPVIGYNRDSDSYPMHSFDSGGNVSVMQARLEQGTWSFVGETLRFKRRSEPLLRP